MSENREPPSIPQWFERSKVMAFDSVVFRDDYWAKVSIVIVYDTIIVGKGQFLRNLKRRRPYDPRIITLNALPLNKYPPQAIYQIIKVSYFL